MVAYLREFVDAGCRHIVIRINTFTDYDRILHAIGEYVVPAIHQLEVAAMPSDRLQAAQT
jgi:hypothetical protein